MFSRSPLVTSTVAPRNYSWTLGNNAPTFTRPGSSGGTFYYHAKSVSVSVSGYYSFSTSTTFPAYWYLYVDRFDARNPTTNLYAQGYHSGSGSASQFSVYLEVGSSKRRRRVRFMKCVSFCRMIHSYSRE